MQKMLNRILPWRRQFTALKREYRGLKDEYLLLKDENLLLAGQLRQAQEKVRVLKVPKLEDAAGTQTAPSESLSEQQLRAWLHIQAVPPYAWSSRALVAALVKTTPDDILEALGKKLPLDTEKVIQFPERHPVYVLALPAQAPA